MKKPVIIVVLCIAFFWGGRIYSTNQIKDKVDYYDMQSVVENDGISINPLESHLYTVNEYIERFHISMEDIGVEDMDSRIICICLEMTNGTERDISWDEIMARTECGFETLTWMSSVSPYTGSKINVFTDESFKPNATQKIWYATTINRVCFRQKTWENMQEESFYYVLSLSPRKIKIRLEI
ncbi:MAG: hypothetical protein K2K56_09370 [Lachnospiraceae bacterium]|nr:hypothetical protein [Lachnospiraceae bacterium]